MQKNKPKDKEEVTPKKPLEFQNFAPFSPYPEFYYPSLKPDFISPGSFYNPYSGYPALSPRFGGQFPGIPILLPEIPSPKKDKPPSKAKGDKSKGDTSEKDESGEVEGSGKEEEESDKNEEDSKEDNKDDERNGKPKISIIRVLQLPVLPVLRGPPSWPQPRIDTFPLDPIPNTISYDGFPTRFGNPWYNGPILGRSFAPQYILRR